MSLVQKLCKAKLEFSAIGKDGAANLGNRTYKYMTLDAIVSAIGQPLARNGVHFYHTFTVKDGILEVTCILTDGTEVMTNSIPMPIPQGGHNPAQAMGSVITYGKRYSLAALLGIAADEDDDGQQAAKKEGAVNTSPVAPKGEVAKVLDKTHKIRIEWLEKQFETLELSNEIKERIIRESYGKSGEQLRREIEACLVK